jgi:hypothetical protein
VTTVSMRNTGSTDHESFHDVGVPGFQFIQDPRDYKTRSLHSNQDVYERLSPGDLKQAAVVEAIFVYNTAMREQMLPRTPLPVPELFEEQREPLKDIFLVRSWRNNLRNRRICRSIEEKLLRGFAHLFRPTYAGANMGHPYGVVDPSTV